MKANVSNERKASYYLKMKKNHEDEATLVLRYYDMYKDSGLQVAKDFLRLYCEHTNAAESYNQKYMSVCKVN